MTVDANEREQFQRWLDTPGSLSASVAPVSNPEVLLEYALWAAWQAGAKQARPLGGRANSPWMHIRARWVQILLALFSGALAWQWLNIPPGAAKEALAAVLAASGTFMGFLALGAGMLQEKPLVQSGGHAAAAGLRARFRWAAFIQMVLLYYCFVVFAVVVAPGCGISGAWAAVLTAGVVLAIASVSEVAGATFGDI